MLTFPAGRITRKVFLSLEIGMPDSNRPCCNRPQDVVEQRGGCNYFLTRRLPSVRLG
ncbi:hypothetical protein Pan189_37850 [Stratiformator vulcanicus]|uniref:Uncharacterized protein n=1 Tax=Stratiformator vulcanicus TaxID=2527980 RepID=A0A517R667_9PLAN|nr:hypothetical protein Pan189_37850 [Stratiformator vulcanicus]